MDTSRRLVAISTAVGGFALVVALYRYYRAKTDDKNDGSARDSERSSGSGSEPKMPLLDSKKSVDFLLDKSIARSRSLLRNTHVSNSGDCSESSSVTSDDRGLIKGYKTREDGSKTSYFSREISDADKKLLGDSSPQKISSSLLQQPRTNSATPESTPPRSGSKWNKAGTYEERDLKGWGKQTMEKLLTLVSLESPRERLKATICNVKIIECDCSISFARSKKRYMYDMTMSCDFVVSATGRGQQTTLSGKVLCEDVTPDCDYAIRITVDEPGSDPRLLSFAQGRLRGLLASKLDEFKQTFLAEY